MLIDDSWFTRPPNVRERIGAGGVVVRSEGSRLLVALVCGDDDGDYVLPKGGTESGETLEETARREVGEEAGLTELDILADLGTIARLNYNRDCWQVIRYYLFRTEQIDARPSDATYGYRTAWRQIDDLTVMFWPDQRALIQNNQALTMPSGLPRSARASAASEVTADAGRLIPARSTTRN
ncbi:MAG TPA: NUDIX domain-containing protein [Chthonomonadaceae bacterium]|nr:NUDIX domain-containing protein [Chthonomonadaceae bacterium]